MFLVDSGRNRFVRTISSVSGGSIANGFVAQRCDFRNVGPKDFDKVVSEFATAMISGLLSKRALLAAYGSFAAGLVGLGIAAKYLGMPSFTYFVLFVVFGVVILLRGRVLVRMLRKHLFEFPDAPLTLGSIARATGVDHVFCATDLNASMPVYFTSTGMHFYSPAWGHAAQEKASDISLAEVVRASAAFPGGIPPKRLDVRNLGLSLTPLSDLQRWQDLVLGRVAITNPSVLYLADGGVWNNLGTDWLQPSTEKYLMSGVDWHGGGQLQLVIDATAPTPLRLHLKLFWLPYVAELLSLSRVLLVSYTSTVNARLQELVHYDQSDKVTTTSAPHQWVARVIDFVPDARTLGRIVWMGEPDHWSGRRSLALACRRILRGETPSKRPVVKRLSSLNDSIAWVPTTLFAVTPEVALQLLMQGYLSTAQALSGSKDAVAQFPGVERFARLLGLEARPIPGANATFVGPASEMSKYRMNLLLSVAEDTLNEIKSWTPIFITAREATEKQKEDDVALLDTIRREDAAMEKSIARDFDLKMKMIGALLLAFHEQYHESVSQFTNLFSRISIADKSVDSYTVATFALSLARTGDARARDTLPICESKLIVETVTPANRKRTLMAWWNAAEAYALLKDSENAVRCLREASTLEPKLVNGFMLSHRGMNEEEDAFSPIRDTPEFAAFEERMIGKSQAVLSQT